MTTTDTEPLPEELRRVVLAARAKKAEDLRVLDVREVAAFTDYFVIASGGSARQVQAIVDAVVEQLREIGRRPHHIEGTELGEWVLIDYGDLIVHVFQPARRSLYDLERLWSDARVVALPEAAA